MKVFCSKDGEFCLAKTGYTVAFSVFLSIITYKEFNGLEVNYGGMSAYLIAIGSVYFGRSHTKARGTL